MHPLGVLAVLEHRAQRARRDIRVHVPGTQRVQRRRLPQVTEQLAREVARATAKLRTLDLLKPPGIAESMDWATALHTLGARDLDPDLAARTLGARDLDPDLAARTLGAVLKYREDTERVQALARGALFGG